MRKITITEKQLKNIVKESLENNNSKVTPERIDNMGPNDIFVFGSNEQGLHAGGAALFAYKKLGAEWGNGVGLQGQTYAIPTLSVPGGFEEDKLPIPKIKGYVDDMLKCAQSHPDLHFYVTPIGCGIAGFTPQEMAPLFAPAMNMENVSLPASFINILEGQNNEI